MRAYSQNGGASKALLAVLVLAAYALRYAAGTLQTGPKCSESVFAVAPTGAICEEAKMRIWGIQFAGAPTICCALVAVQGCTSVDDYGDDYGGRTRNSPRCP